VLSGEHFKATIVYFACSHGGFAVTLHFIGSGF